MSLSIASGFKGKSIFFTGVTGFVGKVLLYKLLSSFGSDIGKIYVLIRTRKGKSPAERLREQVCESPCFDPLRERLGGQEGFLRLVKEKVVAVAGDILDDRLGISSEDYARITAEVNYVIHVAATVNFMERLDVSVGMNVLGTLRVLALARHCAHLDAMVHTSTCYVNWSRDSGEIPVMEKIYPSEFDPVEIVKSILAMHPDHVEEETKDILRKYKFPNTYALTKNITEQLLQKYKGTLPLSIVRPAIIGCAWREPMPGWVDALTAAGVIILTAGLGVLHEFHCRSDYIADMVPVDYVVNTLIKAAYFTARVHASKTPKVAGGGIEKQPPWIFAVNTSGTQNQFRWRMFYTPVRKLWTQGIIHPKQVGGQEFYFIGNEKEQQVRFFLRRKMQYFALKTIMSLPGLSSEKMSKQLGMFKKMLSKVEYMNGLFAPFTTKQWIFDNSNNTALNEGLDEKSLKEFNTDVYDIQWYTYCQLYSWGMCRYILKNKSIDAIKPRKPYSATEIFEKAKM